MKRHLPSQPIKIIDDFLETPDLWRHYALSKEFVNNRTLGLDLLNPQLFHSLARNLIKHIQGKSSFSRLETTFISTDASFGSGWIQRADPFYTVVGTIFLNPESVQGTGLLFYNKIGENDQNYDKMSLDESNSVAVDRAGFNKYKHEQQTLFRKNMVVENVFNRCVLFPPGEWHNVQQHFGNDSTTQRLTLNFAGVAV